MPFGENSITLIPNPKKYILPVTNTLLIDVIGCERQNREGAFRLPSVGGLGNGCSKCCSRGLEK